MAAQDDVERVGPALLVEEELSAGLSGKRALEPRRAEAIGAQGKRHSLLLEQCRARGCGMVLEQHDEDVVGPHAFDRPAPEVAPLHRQREVGGVQHRMGGRLRLDRRGPTLVDPPVPPVREGDRQAEGGERGHRWWRRQLSAGGYRLG